MGLLLKVHAENPGERHLKMITECLHEGGVIICPTDTVYGLACDITKIKALDRVAQIKGIRREKANFSFICHSLSHLSDFTRPIPTQTYKMMKRAFPGPYTFILNASNNIPHFFQTNKKTVGIRIPDHNVPLQIVEKLGNPIMTTSLHDDDEIVEYTTDPELIFERYKKVVDIVIDSGPGGNVPSTVIDVTGDEPVLVRQGKGIFTFPF
jgi:tRNA threonylcarbamoyl adenosine modification protein (Sua5/YciO/YrdC/YwlC family)